ncbi:hypothetical protein KC352_g23849, partial [Hortaea werneckii]
MTKKPTVSFQNRESRMSNSSATSPVANMNGSGNKSSMRANGAKSPTRQGGKQQEKGGRPDTTPSGWATENEEDEKHLMFGMIVQLTPLLLSNQPSNKAVEKPTEPSAYEKKKQTFITRAIWTFVMIAIFFGSMFAGHIYVI